VAGTLLAGQVADRRIPRMRWVRIVPLLIMINTVSYIDRFNIGYAIAGGLDADLKLGAAFSGLATGVCFWGYFVLQFPGGHWAEPGHAKTIMTCSLLAWSCLTIGMAFVTTGSQLLVMRFIVIAHPTPGTGLVGSFVASTKRRTSSTEARLAFAVLTRERKAA
jgi:MFS family permease